MINFNEWFKLREERDIESSFAQTEREINKYFQSLQQAIELTLKSKEKVPSITDEKFRKKIVDDLQAILNKVKVGGKTELDLSHVTEAAITQGLKQVRVNPESGRPVFTVKDVINSIKDKIIGSIENLKHDLVMSKLGSLEKKVEKIPASIQRASAPHQPLTHTEERTAFDSGEMLSKLLKQARPGQIQILNYWDEPMTFNNSSEFLRRLHKAGDKRIKVRWGGKEEVVSTGSIEAINSLVDTIRDEFDISGLPPGAKATRGRKALKLRGF